MWSFIIDYKITQVTACGQGSVRPFWPMTMAIYF